MFARQRPLSHVRAAAALLALALGLAACGGPEDEPSTVATAHSTRAPDDTGAVDASDDRFCELSQEGIALSSEAVAQTEAAFVRLTEAAMEGDDALAGLAEIAVTIEDTSLRSRALYAEAVTYVTDDPAAATAFEQIGHFIELYSLPVAEIMQNATSFEQMAADLGALVGTPEVRAAVDGVEGYATTAEVYTENRCSIDIA